MKKIMISIFIVFLIVGIFLGINFKLTIDKPLKVEGEETLVINEGDSFYTMLDSLKQENKVKNPIYIKVYSKLSENNLEVLPGEYKINEKLSLKELIELVTTHIHKQGAINITIPEGYNIDEIANKLDKENICEKDNFLKAINEYELPSYVKQDSQKRYSLEGYLFPDTYNFEEGVTADEIISAMIARFEEVWFTLLNQSTVGVTEDSIEQIMTIAAMIEKEAVVDEDRALISSVIGNRLNIDMLLQIDATVIYSHGKHLDPVLYKHLEIDSPYNTYKYIGLPAGPICNPGIESIEAALNPEETNYLFYLVESEGEHYFTDSYDDFEKKKAEFGY